MASRQRQHFRLRHFVLVLATAFVGGIAIGVKPAAAEKVPPNLVFVFIDDHRFDAMGCAGNPLVQTPNIDRLAARGVRFDRAFVTLSICSPSRAAVLTGRYGSANGVINLGLPLKADEKTFAQLLGDDGYRTALVGKWHIGRRMPSDCGFDFVVRSYGNGPHFNRSVIDNGKKTIAKGFIEDYFADRAVDFIKSAAEGKKPFVLHLCTQVPHMNHKFDWTPRPETLKRYKLADMPVPKTWQDDLSGKPPYLKTGRNYQRAQETYGYDKAENIRRHFRNYYGAITEMDAALGKVFDAIDQLHLRDNTYILLMGDNGWMMGDHGFTSKVLPYEPSIRVPLIVAGPGIKPGVCNQLVLNIDTMPTLLEMAGVAVPKNVHGRSLMPLLKREPTEWRNAFLYEAPSPALGSQSLYAVRTQDFKYIRTLDRRDSKKASFEELYDLRNDPGEMNNLAEKPELRAKLAEMQTKLSDLRKEIVD